MLKEKALVKKCLVLAKLNILKLCLILLMMKMMLIALKVYLKKVANLSIHLIHLNKERYRFRLKKDQR